MPAVQVNGMTTRSMQHQVDRCRNMHAWPEASILRRATKTCPLALLNVIRCLLATAFMGAYHGYSRCLTSMSKAQVISLKPLT
jgi:hypothetical protein